MGQVEDLSTIVQRTVEMWLRYISRVVKSTKTTRECRKVREERSHLSTDAPGNITLTPYISHNCALSF